jgi:hypothetical protein
MSTDISFDSELASFTVLTDKQSYTQHTQEAIETTEKGSQGSGQKDRKGSCACM